MCIQQMKYILWKDNTLIGVGFLFLYCHRHVLYPCMYQLYPDYYTCLDVLGVINPAPSIQI